MKKITTFTVTSFLFALFLAFGANASAQPSRPTAEEIINKLEQKLDLTDEQIRQIYPIIEEQMTKRKELIEKVRSQGFSARRSMKSKMKEINKETETKLAAHLSSEQLSQWKKIQKEMRSEMRGKMRGSGRFGRGFGRGR